METKICSKCHQEKPLEEFGIDKRTISGRKSRCRNCTNNDEKVYRAKNKEMIARRQKKYRAKNHTEIRRREREYIKRTTENLSDNYIRMALRDQYGLKAEDVNKYPDLINLKRLEIESKRSIKQLKQIS